MDDVEINTRTSSDEFVLFKLHQAVCSGEQLKDTAISDNVADIRNQLRCMKQRHDATSRAKDNILLCLSTLLSAARKKLCTRAALLYAMIDADFALIVSN